MKNQNKPWQKQYIYNSLIAFFGGLCGASVLFIISYLIFDIAHLKNPLLLLPFGRFFDILIVAGLIEEGTKFLLIKRDIGQYPYGFLLGLGFGTSEAILVHPFWESKAIFQGRLFAITLHILTAGIICYFVKKKKPFLGLLIATLIHTGYDSLLLIAGVY